MDGRHEFEIYWNADGLPRVKLCDVAAWKKSPALDGGTPLLPDGRSLTSGEDGG